MYVSCKSGGSENQQAYNLQKYATACFHNSSFLPTWILKPYSFSCSHKYRSVKLLLNDKITENHNESIFDEYEPNKRICRIQKS